MRISDWSSDVCSSDLSDVVLDFLASEKAPALAALGTSCPDHFLRTTVKPMLLDLRPDAPVEDSIARLKEMPDPYRADYQAYSDGPPDATSPAIRDADTPLPLIPRVWMSPPAPNNRNDRRVHEKARRA